MENSGLQVVLDTHFMRHLVVVGILERRVAAMPSVDTSRLDLRNVLSQFVHLLIERVVPKKIHQGGLKQERLA